MSGPEISTLAGPGMHSSTDGEITSDPAIWNSEADLLVKEIGIREITLYFFSFFSSQQRYKGR